MTIAKLYFQHLVVMLFLLTSTTKLLAMEIDELAQLIASNKTSAKSALIEFLMDADHNDINELISEFSYTEEGEGVETMFELLGVDRTKVFLKKQLEDEGAGLFSGAQYLISNGVDVNDIFEGVPIILQSVFKSEDNFSEYHQEPFEDQWNEEVETADSLRIELLKNGANLKLLDGEGYIDFVNALSEDAYSICKAFFDAGYQLKTNGVVINGEQQVSELQYVLEDVYSDHEALEELYGELLTDWTGIDPLNKQDERTVIKHINSYFHKKANTIEFLVQHGAIKDSLKLQDTNLEIIFQQSLEYLKELSEWGLYGSRGFNLKSLLERNYPELGSHATDIVDGEDLLTMLFDDREKHIRKSLKSIQVN
jgi:hypothetical protein